MGLSDPREKLLSRIKEFICGTTHFQGGFGVGAFLTLQRALKQHAGRAAGFGGGKLCLLPPGLGDAGGPLRFSHASTSKSFLSHSIQLFLSESTPFPALFVIYWRRRAHWHGPSKAALVSVRLPTPHRLIVCLGYQNRCSCDPG